MDMLMKEMRRISENQTFNNKEKLDDLKVAILISVENVRHQFAHAESGTEEFVRPNSDLHSTTRREFPKPLSFPHPQPSPRTNVNQQDLTDDFMEELSKRLDKLKNILRASQHSDSDHEENEQIRDDTKLKCRDALQLPQPPREQAFTPQELTREQILTLHYPIHVQSTVFQQLIQRQALTPQQLGHQQADDLRPVHQNTVVAAQTPVVLRVYCSQAPEPQPIAENLLANNQPSRQAQNNANQPGHRQREDHSGNSHNRAV